MGRAIPITDGHGTLLPDAWPRILAVMIWPEDERACSDLHASMVARAFVEHGYRNEILKDPARRYGSRWEKALPRLGQLWTAGELLQLVLNTLLESPREATLYRAIHLYQRDYGGGQLHDGQMVSFSQRYLRGVWNQFKSVAHLTAAWKVMRESGRSAELEVLGLLSNSEASASWGNITIRPSAGCAPSRVRFRCLTRNAPGARRPTSFPSFRR